MQNGIRSVAISRQTDRARPDKVIWCGISAERNHESRSKRLGTKHARCAQKRHPRAATNSVSALLDFLGNVLANSKRCPDALSPGLTLVIRVERHEAGL